MAKGYEDRIRSKNRLKKEEREKKKKRQDKRNAHGLNVS
jgi:hypothetical protein